MATCTVCSVLGILLLVVVCTYSLFIIHHILYWLKLKQAEKPTIIPQTKVSIIVPARNEEKNIVACLGAILAQDYPTTLMEIIVCNDHSEDSTKEKAIEALNGTSIKHTYIEAGENSSGKKATIELGVKASSGDLILITDADCLVGTQWVPSMVSIYESTRANMICGPVALLKGSNYCEKFQELELCGLSLLAGAGINAGMPLLSNAANIAFTRKAFEAVKGFAGITGTPSGDDTLLMFKIQQKFPGTIHYAKCPEATVYGYAQPNWKDFLQQRIRWASKGFHSKNMLNSIVSLTVFLANFLLLICAIRAFIYPVLAPYVLWAAILKLSVDFLLLYFAAKFFKKTKLLFYYPVAVITVMVYSSVVGIMANFTSFTWKGRKYKV